MPFANDYIDVASRIVEFRAKYPEGTLQAEVIRWPEDGFPFIAVMAHAYRTDDDQRPGVGLAYEPFPGKTNFTRDSELQNAETSAWGRALVAVGAADTRKGIASADEVRNRQASPAQSESPATATTTAASTARSERAPVAGGSSAPPAMGSTERTAGGPEAAGEDASGPSAPHVHQWIPSPRLSKFEVCSVEGCFETKKKGAAA